jgi:hypothetical protein
VSLLFHVPYAGGNLTKRIAPQNKILPFLESIAESPKSEWNYLKLWYIACEFDKAWCFEVSVVTFERVINEWRHAFVRKRKRNK